MRFNNNYNDMKMKNVKEEEAGGIHSNAFLPFSQNRLECRYGFFVKHGRINHAHRELQKQLMRGGLEISLNLYSMAFSLTHLCQPSLIRDTNFDSRY